MSTQVQYRRGTTGQNDAFTGALAEITVDTTTNTLRVHDGITAGGFPVVGTTQVQTLTNKTLTSPLISSPSVTGTITGNLVPAANVTYNLGSSTAYWNDLYLAGNTIYLGTLQLKDTGAGALGVFQSDGTTRANVALSEIVYGNTTFAITSAGGNAIFSINGVNSVLAVTPLGIDVEGDAEIIGDIAVNGNLTVAHVESVDTITASGNVSANYFIGNGSQLTGIDATAIQNGTANVRTFLNGNVAITAAGTANVVVVTTAGSNVAGTLDVTGNVTGGNLTTAGAVVATGNVAASGNISGNYLLGNAFFVTGLSPTRIYNGASEVNIGTSGGNANISIGGTANVLVAASTGISVSGFISNVNMNSHNITSLATPVNDNDAANKLYVDNLVSTGIHYHTPVRVEAPLNLNATYNNGTSGVGATLTNAGANAALSIDGISLNVNDRVLVYEQTDQTQNGVYVVTTVGDGSTAWVLTRASDADTYAPSTSTGLDEGSYFYVQEGNTGAGESYVCNTIGTITFGTTNITFAQFSASQVYQAGTGLTLINTTFSVDASQTQITSVGTLTALSVTGNISGGNLVTTGDVTTATVTASGNISASYFIGNGSQLTGIDATAIQNGTANVRTFLDGNVAITAAGTANVLVVTNGGATLTGSITNGGANGAGNIGSSTTYFNTVFAKATSAQYADLAEMYVSDADYEPGTVVVFGGPYEVSASAIDGDTRVAGVVSTNPSYLMNATCHGQHVVPVAMVGRVPTWVTGPVRKGDMMIASANGRARSSVSPALGSVIGKALEDFDGDMGIIEVVVGRL